MNLQRPSMKLLASMLVVCLPVTLVPIFEPALPARAATTARLPAWSQARALSNGVGTPQVTDLTDTSFAVVFTTAVEQAAGALYGTSPSSLNSTALDDRDAAAGATQPSLRSTIHRITLTGLAQRTTYYFEPLVDRVPQTDPLGQPFHQTTMPTLSIQMPSRVHGTVVTAVTAVPAPGTVLLLGHWVNPDGSSSWPVSALNGAATNSSAASTYDFAPTLVLADGSGPFVPAVSAIFTVQGSADAQGQAEVGPPASAVKGANITLMPLLVLSVVVPAPTLTPTPTSTSTSIPSWTVTNTPTRTSTATPTGTSTPASTNTAVPTNTGTETQTRTPSTTATATRTGTTSRTATAVVRRSPTTQHATATPSRTATPATSKGLSRCALGLILARTVASRTGSDALFIAAKPGAKLVVHFGENVFPSSATLFTTSQHGATLRGKIPRKTVDYSISVPADGMALLVFDVPGKAGLGKVGVTVVTNQSCTLAATRQVKVVLTVKSAPKQGPEQLGTAAKLRGAIVLRFDLPADVSIPARTLAAKGLPVQLLTMKGKRTAEWIVLYPPTRNH
jgi:hypothetical protein